MTAKAEQKSFAASDETREFERGTLAPPIRSRSSVPR